MRQRELLLKVRNVQFAFVKVTSPLLSCRLMQWCCLSLRTTLCTGPPRTLWMLGWAWEVDRLRRAIFTRLTTSRPESGSGKKRVDRSKETEWTWVVRGHGSQEEFIRTFKIEWVCGCVCSVVCLHECVKERRGRCCRLVRHLIRL